MVDWNNHIYSILPKGELEIINQDLPSHAIAWDYRYGLIVSQWDMATLFYRTDDGHWVKLLKEIRPLRLFTNGNDEVIIHQHRMPNHHFKRIEKSSLVEVAKIDSDALLDTAHSESGMLLIESHSIKRLHHNNLDYESKLWRPTAAAVQGNIVYLLSEEGRMLYKIMPDNSVEQLDLYDTSMGDGYIKSIGSNGFRVLKNNLAFIAMGDTLVKLDLNAANWRSLDD